MKSFYCEKFIYNIAYLLPTTILCLLNSIIHAFCFSDSFVSVHSLLPNTNLGRGVRIGPGVFL